MTLVMDSPDNLEILGTPVSPMSLHDTILANRMILVMDSPDNLEILGTPVSPMSLHDTILANRMTLVMDNQINRRADLAIILPRAENMIAPEILIDVATKLITKDKIAKAKEIAAGMMFVVTATTLIDDSTATDFTAMSMRFERPHDGLIVMTIGSVTANVPFMFDMNIDGPSRCLLTMFGITMTSKSSLVTSSS